MKGRIHDAPFALACDGTVLVNLGEFDGPRSPQALLTRALAERGAVFIGVQLAPEEVKRVLVQVGDHCSEAAAYVAGARQKHR